MTPAIIATTAITDSAITAGSSDLLSPFLSTNKTIIAKQERNFNQLHFYR